MDDDPWGSHAWSSATHEANGTTTNKPLEAPKWNSFQRDADDDTVDVGIPSWSAAGNSTWEDGANLWNSTSVTLDTWSSRPSISSGVETVEETEDEAREAEVEEESEDTAEEEVKQEVVSRVALPTPPSSPLPSAPLTPPTPPSEPTELPDDEPLSRRISLLSPPSPDPFGSFESANISDRETATGKGSWSPRAATFPSDNTEQPWGSAWSGDGEAHDDEDDELQDEWQAAQEARRKRDRKVPPELLKSLLAQWEVFAKDAYPLTESEQDKSYSWRKGLDNVEGLTEWVDGLIPPSMFPPPLPFPKTMIAKTVKETVRLTRSYGLTQSSPMARLYASKGSSDWERSVKAQKLSANDEWGWDLKHDGEDISEPKDSGKDKKSGLLSFWGRRASNSPSTSPAFSVESPMLTSGIQPRTSSPAPKHSSKPSSPTRPNTDISASTVNSPTQSSSTSVLPMTNVAPLVTDETVAVETTSQPSAVSRFLNRFSRKPAASAASGASSDKEKHSSLQVSLSADDLSFLSDLVPSEGLSRSPQTGGSAGSLEAILSMSSNGAKNVKLPPPLAPPPRPSSLSVTPSKVSSRHTADAIFDAQMDEARLFDSLNTAGLLSSDMMPGAGTKPKYTPISFDALESPVDVNTPADPSASVGSSSAPLFPLSGSSLLPISPSLYTPSSTLSTPTSFVQASASQSVTPMLPLIPPPDQSSKPSPNSTQFKTIPPPTLLPPSNAQPFMNSIRLESPLPPAPKNKFSEFDEFSDFVSEPSIIALPTNTSSLALSHSDFGDFGDFTSTPPVLRTPPPPKVPKKFEYSVNHKPTIELVQKAATRVGRWPTPPSPIPQPLPPPPGSAASTRSFDDSPMRQAQNLGETLFPVKSPISPVRYDTPVSLPVSKSPPPRHASTSFPLFAPPPAAPTRRPAMPLLSPPIGTATNPTTNTSTVFSEFPSLPLAPTPGSVTPTLSPPNTAATTPATKSGLSALDLSFFEGL